MGGLNASFCMHLCVGICVLIDDLKRKMSTLVKRDTKILSAGGVCDW